MTVIEDMLRKYRDDHQHPVNRATHMIGIPLITFALPTMLLDWRIGLGMFAGGWALQLIGHAFEGKKPSFLTHPGYLLVGPLYFVKKLLGRS